MSRPPEKPIPRPRARPSGQLTDREIQILSLVAAGEPTHAISRRLGITEHTIKTHLTSVYKKTGSRNRVQAARHYLDHYTTHPGEPPPAPAATDRPRRAGEPSPLIQRQVQEIEARLEQLAPAASEAETLQHALDALRAIEPR
jgi:DNA-binding CsgD family transcriptional regulator